IPHRELSSYLCSPDLDGETDDIPAREVTVHRFDLEDIRRANDGKTIDIDVEVECTAGTYIRALARDLGEALNTGGYLTALRRTAVGPYRIEDAVTMDELADDFVYTDLSTAMIRLFPTRIVSQNEAQDLIHGRRIAASESNDLLAATLQNGQAIALITDAERAGKIEAKPEIVFATLEHLTGAPS